jgi:tetratricopeptide (TPR) repeat protein
MVMKLKFGIAVAALFLSAGTYAQKEELKTLKKIYGKEKLSDKDLSEYKSNVAKAQTMLASATEDDKVYISFYQSAVPLLDLQTAMAKPENAGNAALISQIMTIQKIEELSTAMNNVIEYEKKTGKKIHTKDIEETVATINPILLNYAVALGTQKKNSEASSVLYSVYKLDKSKPDNLYFAASYAVNGGDYETALNYYNELKALKYSGEGVIYFATNAASGKEEQFPTKADRDRFVALTTHKSPRDEKIPSKRGEIYKNIALILVKNDKIEEAKAAFVEAKQANPNDVSLLTNEADLYARLKDFDTYRKLINNVLEKNPNDATLIYNLGVVSLEAEQLADAEKYFNRALELDPKMGNAYLNLSAVKLRPDAAIVKEMNSLGTSAKDNKRYDELKKQRTLMFQSAMPHLEKAHQIDPNNQDVITNLLSVYNFLEMTDKYKALKAKKQ